MFVGPIFHRELAVAPRRSRFYIYRAVYAAALTVLIATAWLILKGTQVVRNVNDMARFGTLLFQILAPLQLSLILFYTAMMTASSVALEKDRQTLILLLMTRLNNSELVLGKLFANLLHAIVMVVAGLPIFFLVMMFGGVSLDQVIRVFTVTLASAILAGSLGTLIGFWREKTFQSLALTVLVICFWIGFWEAVASGVLGTHWSGLSTAKLASYFSPVRAIIVASQPNLVATSLAATTGTSISQTLALGRTGPFVACALGLSALLCFIGITCVRRWNPSRQLRQRAAGDTDAGRETTAAVAREGHVDSKLRKQSQDLPTRRVWDNPVLWREVCTWAYGRKIILIRFAYLLLVGLISYAVWNSAAEPAFGQATEGIAAAIPQAAKPLIPLFLISLVLVNALAVTAITNERDGRSLDLLLATDLSPKEFVFGKLGGVFWVTGLMIVCPIALAVVAWSRGSVSGENLIFVVGGLLVMNAFVATLGLHCGMRYSNTRSAISVSLGTVFFLFLGVITCIVMMISFSGSFQVQLAPFMAFILGGGVGLYMALGMRNPSKAILTASLLLPFFTFYAITSFLMENNLSVFIVSACSYGFTTAAMLIPALYEFDFAMGRTSAAD